MTSKNAKAKRARAFKARDILAESNRGMLFDLVIFVINLLLMGALTDSFLELARLANNEDDPLAKTLLGLYCVALFVLPPAGSILKRWHFHRRRGFKTGSGGVLDNLGCPLLPLFYFVLMLVISIGAMVLLGEVIFGKDFGKSGAVSITIILTILSLCIAQTLIVFRYFSPPRKGPESAFLRDPRSELLGDVCIFLNMLLFQILWNIVGRMPTQRVSDLTDLGGRIVLLCFLAMMLYLPPRVFYLAEDGRRGAAWLTMLLANSPLILRVIFGTNPNVTG